MNVIAVDVGTTSVRLAIISFRGDKAQEAHILASQKRDIDLKQTGNRFEQSSSQIWQAICECSRQCIKDANVNASTIKSIAFSATCSLVVEHTNPTHISDIIMWMDHRAVEQAQRITASKVIVLNQFGGVCSPEFSLAKLVWLQENEPDLFNSASGFFELPDWLVYKCIGGQPGSCPRSLCCVTCKWGFDVVKNRHCDKVEGINLREMGDKIGKSVLGPGTISGYLCETAAGQLGLKQLLNDKENQGPIDIVVGTSLIDAHSGMLAMLSVPISGHSKELKIESTFCSLAGTSSCHMLLSKERNFTQGIWGPYKDVILSGNYLLEAGQSLTGKLIEICIESHPEGKQRLGQGEKMYDIIKSLNEQIKNSVSSRSDLHVLPTFHGNRSPLANPKLRGGIYGLSASGTKSLCEHYVATIEALVFENKLIIEALDTKLETVLVSGGLMKNDFFMQTLSDVLQCQVVRMNLGQIDFMVMGSGLVARHAALGLQHVSQESGKNTIQPLTKESIMDISYPQLEVQTFEPKTDCSSYFDKKYTCYKEFVELSQRIVTIMDN